MVTVLIFSCNRHGYLKRAIAYWVRSGLPVVIADGSEHRLECDLPSNIAYLHRPRTSLMDRITELSHGVATPYAILCPDDDFVGFNGLRIATAFLEDNPDFSSAQGLYTRFEPEISPGEVPWTWDSRHAARYVFEQDSATARLQAGMTPPLMHYCYSVMRVHALQNTLAVLRDVDELSISTFEISFIPGLLCTGKYATLPVFFGARQAQPRRWGNAEAFEDWVARRSAAGYGRWRANISGLLSSEHRLSRDESYRIVDSVVVSCVAGFRLKSSLRSQDHATPVAKSATGSGRVREAAVSGNRELRRAHAMVRGAWHLSRMFGANLRAHAAFRQDWRTIRSIITANPIDEGTGC